MNEVAFGLIAALATGALIVTKSIDLLRELVDKSNRAPAWVWILGAFAVGVVYCVGWQVDLTGGAVSLVPALAGRSLSPLAGQIVTGLAFGAGADAWHKVLANLSAGTAAKQAR